MTNGNQIPTGGGQAGGTPPVGAPASAKGSGLAPNIAGLLSYIFFCFLPIPCVIFLIIEKENLDVKFHAWQAAILWGVSACVFVLLWILQALFSYIWNFLGVLVAISTVIVFIGLIILCVVCMIKAYQGERFRIPYIGDFAAKKAGI